MPETPIETPISVAILILPSVVPFDLGVPMQVFGYPGIDLGVQRYRATLCAPKPGPVRTANGFDVLVTRGLGRCGRRTPLCCRVCTILICPFRVR